MCILIFSTTFVWNISHSKKIWVKYGKLNFIPIHVKYLLLASGFSEHQIFQADFRKVLKYKIFMKIRLVGAELFPCGQTDRPTDRREPNRRNSVNTPYNATQFN